VPLYVDHELSEILETLFLFCLHRSHLNFLRLFGILVAQQNGSLFTPFRVVGDDSGPSLINYRLHVKFPPLELDIMLNHFIFGHLAPFLVSFPFFFILYFFEILAAQVNVFGHLPLPRVNLSHDQIGLLEDLLRSGVRKLSGVDIAFLLPIIIKVRHRVIVVRRAILSKFLRLCVL
jgi:hypothetical protein